jgi:hypothetical protein
MVSRGVLTRVGDDKVVDFGLGNIEFFGGFVHELYKLNELNFSC